MQNFLKVLLIVICLSILPHPVLGGPYKPNPVSSFKTIPDTDPKIYLTARDYLTIGDTSTAFSLLKKSYRKYPFHESTVTDYLQLIRNKNGLESALEEARHYAKKWDDSKLSKFIRSIEGDTQPLVEFFNVLRKDISLDPDMLNIYTKLLLDSNVSMTRKILSEQPTLLNIDPELRFRLGRAQAREGNCKKGLETINQLIGTYPGWGELYKTKSKLLWDKNREGALKAFETYTFLTSAKLKPGEGPRSVFSCGSNKNNDS